MIIGKFYIYDLIDPRDNKTFYVGKGSGDRVFAHEKNAKRGEKHPRADFIRVLLKQGLSPKLRIVRYFASEMDALHAETSRIEKFGIENLTNQRKAGPFFLTQDPGRDYLNAFVNMWNKTKFQHGHRWLFCQEWHELPENFFPMMRKHLSSFVEKKGREWVCNKIGSNLLDSMLCSG